MKALETIQTSFLWNKTNPKRQHKTIAKNFKKGGLNNVDMQNNLTDLQIS